MNFITKEKLTYTDFCKLKNIKTSNLAFLNLNQNILKTANSKTGDAKKNPNL